MNKLESYFLCFYMLFKLKSLIHSEFIFVTSVNFVNSQIFIWLSILNNFIVGSTSIISY